MRLGNLLFRYLWIALLTGLLPGTPAWAKKVNIEWKAIPGAVHYEIQVEQAGKIVTTKSVEEPSWSGDLGFGFFLYQIRAYDRIKRPGQWTTPKPLVVMPKPPEPTLPADGKKIVLYNPGATTIIKWNLVQGANKYHLEVRRGKTLVHDQIYAGDTTTLKGLPPGQYNWQITAVVEAQGRVPASFQSRTWQSKPSDASEFKIEHEKLTAPIPVAPLGKLEPPSDGRMRFKWKKVDGAESYVLELYQRQAKGRVIAANAPPLSKVTTTDNSIVANVPGEGLYYWRVRALANIDDKQVPAAVGPQSTADFNVDRNASYFEGSGYVALSTMLAPYSYQVISPSTGTNGSTGSAAITVRGSGEYYFHPQWGVGAAVESSMFSIGTDSYNRKGMELMAKYRLKLSDSKFAWGLSPKFGIEERDYFEIFNRGGAANAISSSVYGVDIGLDIRKQISDKMSLGIKFVYFKPLMLTSDRADQITGDASGRNLSLGAQALYWLSSKWGLGAGAYLEKRSISYTVKGGASDAKAEQVYMDGTYFFGSLIYSFGR